METWSKNEKGLMDLDNSVVMGEWGESIRGINGNEKMQNKIKCKTHIFNVLS